MKTNLDTILPEIHDSLMERSLAIFYNEMRAPDAPSAVYWDVEQHPSYERFLDSAVAVGAKLVTLFTRSFQQEQIEEGMEQLEESDLDSRDRHILEKQLRGMHVYEGKTCQIELAFSHGPREYVFDMHADWFDEYGDLMDRIQTAFVIPEDDSPLDGGYYSKN